MLNEVFNLDKIGGEVAALKKKITDGTSCSVFYACQNSRYHITAGLDKFFLLITPDMLSAKAAYEILSEYANGEVVYIPEKEDVLLNAQAFYSEALTERMHALTALLSGKAVGAVASAESLTQYLPEKELFLKSIIELKTNSAFVQEELIDKLITGGYKKTDETSEAGTFAVRGGILDIFPINNDMPLRIEFFGDYIESMRLFAPESMMSIREIKEFTISPKTDIILTESVKESVLRKLSSLKRTAGLRLSEIISENELKLNTGSGSLQWLIPFMTEHLSTVFDYLPKDTVVVFDEIRAIDDKLRLNINAHNIRLKSFVEGGEAVSLHKNSILSLEEIYNRIKQHTILSFQQVTSSNPVFEPDALFNIKSLAVTRYYINNMALITDVKNMLINGAKVFLYAGSADAAKHLSDFFFENGLSVEVSVDESSNNGLLILPKRISKGFNYPKEKIILIGTDELIKKTAEPKKKSFLRKKSAFIVPEKGDFVVHEKHGIGIFEGIVKLDVLGGKRDYYCVLYKAGDKLYLPVDQIDKLDKYTGGGTPALHRIGGKEFERIKDRVKQSVKKLAIDLISLYEKRLNSKGHKYQDDTVWQKEMEDSFEFTETDDQLIAIAEIKDDMEKGRLMDRLLCGDVGFGKTEVAMRAIFKTIIEGKQAAFLAPTTILCGQHYNTLSQRFKPFGITVDVLSRFMSNEYIQEALERIKNGKTSVVVATHRLLSKDVVFNDLGLLVLDEEQRFGVEHKEKIKLLKTNINVLSLSATPIPRTLHMAMSGIRDISTLETPPKNRLPVETYVVEYSDSLLIDAVKRELQRGGQVYILYNRVATITTFHRYISDLLGEEASVIYAHGQMDTYDLEERIRAFYNKEANVLISTTIIENGIDLPDANTLIVIDADMLGLSELYQLRGRVGRSHNLAYAYFTVKEGKVLTSDATKRLEAIMTHTALGSGFKIAMEDLEIRGAGNVLGREQHGSMEKVGYDLYCKLLSESIDELKGTVKKSLKEVEIIIDGDASLPDDYIKSSEQRIRFYKEIAILSGLEDETELIGRLTESYQKPPVSVLNLIGIGLIKNLAANLNIKKIIMTTNELNMAFYDDSIFQNELIFKALADYKDKAILLPSTPPSIMFNNKKLTLNDRIKLIKSFILKSIHNL